MPESVHISFAQHEFELLPSGGMVCDQMKTLFVADVHLGKAASYRHLGQPVPVGTTSATLQQLSHDLLGHNIDHLIVLGDLFHSRRILPDSPTAQAIASWRDQHMKCCITLVRGNHDAGVDELLKQFNIDVVDQHLVLGNLLCCHDEPEPRQSMGTNVLLGHVHPVVILKGKGKDRLRLPCFLVSQHQCLLPAYGAFTGGHVVKPRADQACYVLAQDQVLKVCGPV